MKKTGLFLPVVLFLLFSGLTTNAQNSNTATSGSVGGPAEMRSGTSNEASNMTGAGTECLIIKIVEHTYEITAIAGRNDHDINIEPVSNSHLKMDSLTLRVDNYDPEFLSYRVFDYMGNLQCSDSIRGFETKIPAQDVPAGEYYLKVMYGKRELKTFKVIKN
jgi:hypothetical protein